MDKLKKLKKSIDAKLQKDVRDIKTGRELSQNQISAASKRQTEAAKQEVPKIGPIGNGSPKTPQEDPFAWSDVKNRKTLNELMIRNKMGKPVQIHTGSDLVAHDEYVQHIPHGSEINLYSKGHVRENNPGFPSQKRLEAAGEKLENHGFKVNYHDFVEKPTTAITKTGVTLSVAPVGDHFLKVAKHLNKMKKTPNKLVTRDEKIKQALEHQSSSPFSSVRDDDVTHRTKKQPANEKATKNPLKVVKSLEKSSGNSKMLKCLQKCKSMMKDQKDPLAKNAMMAPPAPAPTTAQTTQPLDQPMM